MCITYFCIYLERSSNKKTKLGKISLFRNNHSVNLLVEHYFRILLCIYKNMKI